MTLKLAIIIFSMTRKELSKKLLERKVRLALDAIDGISNARIISIDPDEFAFHRSAVINRCGIDTPASVRWDSRISDKDLLSNLSERIMRYGNIFTIPFEFPYAIQVTIDDFNIFAKSIWRLHGTRDLVLYAKDPQVIFNLQDLEYELAYFEICE